MFCSNMNQHRKGTERIVPGKFRANSEGKEDMDATPLGVLISAGAVTALLVCALFLLSRSRLFRCKCPSCEGTGSCIACGGTGASNGDSGCHMCDGSGKCFVCGGKGSY